ncbi:GTP cyclohydrolase [Dirofilaria immitis]
MLSLCDLKLANSKAIIDDNDTCGLVNVPETQKMNSFSISTCEVVNNEQFIIKTSEIGGSRNMLTLLRKKKFKTYSQDYTFPLILKAYILQLINRKYWKTGPKLKNLF